MKAFVTGPDGLLGSNLVRRLLERGIGVKALVFEGSESTTLDGLDIEKVSGDILDPKSLGKAIKGCDAVFHVAASTSMWPPRAPIITRINVEGTKNVLAAAKKAKVKKFVHVGSASSFGYGTKEEPGTEETPYKYTDIGLAYYDSKREAQKIVLQSAAAGEIDAVVVNPTFMFGPHDFLPSSGRMIVRGVKLQPPAYPSGGRNFVHVRDVADGMINALDKGRTGECYICGNRNMSMKEIFDTISDVAGTRPPRFRIPDAVILAAGNLGTLYGLATRKPPDLTVELARSSIIGSYYTPAKAVREIDLPQTPVESAIEDSYRWLSDNGYMG